MSFVRSANIRSLLKWFLWVLVVQLVLMNISAAFYAHKFTHFYEAPSQPPSAPSNIFARTWKLFVGPRIYKSAHEPEPHFPFQTCRFTTPDGISIDSWYSTVDRSKGCVILFHGLMVNKSFVSGEAAMFRDMGFNVLLVDFRGHGKSGGNETAFGLDESSEVETAFRFAREKGNSRIILYGVSMGAVACIKAIAGNKVRPAALIADAPFASLQSHLKARARVLGFPSQPFGFLVTLWTGVESGYSGFGHSPAADANKVNCPVLLQWGDKDPYVLRSETESVFKNLPAQKKLVVYANAGHESFLHYDPVQWRSEVEGFLGNLR